MDFTAGGFFGIIRSVATTVQDYTNLSNTIPELQNHIKVATDALIAFEADYNTVKTCSLFLVDDGPLLAKSEIQAIDDFVERYRAFLNSFSKSCDDAASERVVRARMAFVGAAGSGVGGLQNLQQFLMNYSNQLQSYHARISDKLGKDEQSTLDSISFSNSATTHYRDPGVIIEPVTVQEESGSDDNDDLDIDLDSLYLNDSDDEEPSTLDRFIGHAAKGALVAYKVTVKPYKAFDI